MEELDCIQILPYESRNTVPRTALFPTATAKQVILTALLRVWSPFSRIAFYLLSRSSLEVDSNLLLRNPRQLLLYTSLFSICQIVNISANHFNNQYMQLTLYAAIIYLCLCIWIYLYIYKSNYKNLNRFNAKRTVINKDPVFNESIYIF